MTLQELQAQALQLSLKERWQLVQQVLASIQQETLATSTLPLTDTEFPHIHHRVGSSGQKVATIKGTGVRVQTLVIAASQWNWDSNKIAEEYDLSKAQVSEALKFYSTHQSEIDDAISNELTLETANFQV